MSEGFLRTVKSSQLRTRVEAFKVTGTGTAAIGEGQYRGTLTDNGTGDYTITFTDAFQRAPVCFATPRTASVLPTIYEATTTAVRVKCYSVPTAEVTASLTRNAAIKFHSQLNGADGNDVTIALTPIAAVAATATLNLTDDIILTSVATGAARNTQTFTLEVAAAAANPTNTILAVISGSAAAIVLTITPNDGTNNAATPVNLTTAQLVELINTGDVAALTGQITITDASSWLNDQTATGGGADVLVDAGEGDHVIATFANGVTATAAGSETITSVSDAGAIVIAIEDGVTTATQLHAAIMADSVLANEARNFISSEVLVGATAIDAVTATNLAGGIGTSVAGAADGSFDLIVMGFDAEQEY